LDTTRSAIRAFIVKRHDRHTVIAGYPWFLDWGRDSLICLRGIIAAGMHQQAEDVILQFAALERNGTLPNMLCGTDDSNRDTSDAPLWLLVACNDLIRATGSGKLLDRNAGDRTVRTVLKSIVNSYISGTPNGIRMDAQSGLIFSPSHFTWMDTCHPAGTPRHGYPIEIQALWYAALMMMAKTEEPRNQWLNLAERVRESVGKYYLGATTQQSHAPFLADCLHALPGTPAPDAEADDALRPNQLLAITLGCIEDPDVARSILQSTAELIVPGAIRSLSDRDVCYPLTILDRNGAALNNPTSPYWGHYTGDEDTRRKPAYHNGTAWTWLFPSYAEALVRIYGGLALRTAVSLLNSAVPLLTDGCMGQIPEILDGDAPHTQRGCGAQAWGVTELHRVLALVTNND